MGINITTELQQHLETSERLLWVGQPKKGVVLRTADVFLIPFSLLWNGFAVFWVVMASKVSVLFAIFGVPFVVIGLIFVFGRFFIDAKQRDSTYYGLTESRIIIKSGLFQKTIKSLNVKSLPDIEYSEKTDGSGTIYFGSKSFFTIWANQMSWWPGIKLTPALDMIQDVRNVYSKIIAIQKTN